MRAIMIALTCGSLLGCLVKLDESKIREDQSRAVEGGHVDTGRAEQALLDLRTERRPEASGDLGRCKVDGDCDDKLGCTKDSCGGNGVCANTLESGYCLIGKTCYTASTPSPSGACERCEPSSSPSGWTPYSPCVMTVVGDSTQGFADGPVATAKLYRPYAVDADSAGAIYIADEYNFRLRMVAQGVVSTLAGTGVSGFADGPAATSQSTGLRGLAVDSAGRVFFADSDNSLIRLVDKGQVSTFAGNPDRVAGFADGLATKARFAYPRGVAVDAAGKVYVADFNNNRVRVIDGNTVSTLAGTGAIGSADGAVASATFNGPRDIVVDGTTVYVADSENHRVRAISGGIVTTIAGTTGGFADGPVATAQLNEPHALAVTPKGLYVADTLNNRIRLIAGGQVTTVAGTGAAGLVNGPAATAVFNNPKGIAAESSGSLLIADHLNSVIRRLIP